MTLEQIKEKLKAGLEPIDIFIDLAYKAGREEAETLLRIARCPHERCDGKGNIPVETADGWEAEQCQWCYEREKLIDNN